LRSIWWAGYKAAYFWLQEWREKLELKMSREIKIKNVE
jgi:hypothetical protein